MNNKLIGFIIGILFIAAVTYFLGAGIFKGLNNKTGQTIGNKLQITASFYPLYYFASQIGGDKVSVANITPSGAEPHDYEPTTQDIAKIQNSKLLILNGSVEAWGDKIRDNLQGEKTKVVVAGQDLLTQQIEEEGKMGIDPHVWLSPQLAKKETEKIANVLEELDPENASYYHDNESKLETRLDQLDQTYKQGLTSCNQKDIITSHAAFGYLAKAYRLNQVPIAGISPDEEPSSQQLAEVADFAKQHNVKYIFFESLVSPKLSETIANEIGAKTLVLVPLEGISDGDMRNGKDYFTVMQQNLTNLQTALECKT